MFNYDRQFKTTFIEEKAPECENCFNKKQLCYFPIQIDEEIKKPYCFMAFKIDII